MVQGSSAWEIFTTLGLTANDIDLLFTAFWDIDADGSGKCVLYMLYHWFLVNKFMSLLDLGLIRPSELFSYFEVEGTKFEKGVFSLFDEGTEG